MSEIIGQSLVVPMELLQNCNGFAMDIGGSLIKLVYIDKEDLDEMERKEPENGKVRIASFTANEMEKGLRLLEQNCHIKRNEQNTPLMFSVGVMAPMYAEVFAERLNVRIDNIYEFDCFVEAFNYFACRMSADELLYDFTETECKQMKSIHNGTFRMMDAVQESSKRGSSRARMVDYSSMDWVQAEAQWEPLSSSKPVSDTLYNMYPCMLVILGSASFFVKLFEDGSFQMIDCYNSGGRTLLGLGALLAGKKKSYDELVTMAEKGSYSNVDVMILDLSRKSPETKTPEPVDGDNPDAYQSALNTPDIYNASVFCYAKAEDDPASVSEEDRLDCLIHTMAQDIVQAMYHLIMLYDFKHVFVAGSYINRKLMRKHIVNDFVRKKAATGSFNEGKGLGSQLHFVKIGSYLGALGALINNTVGFLKKPSTMDSSSTDCQVSQQKEQV